MNNLTPREPYRPLIWTDAVLEIQDLLRDTPYPIYIVGGAVRDAMLHRPIKDLDLATPGDSIALARQIANHFPGGAFFVMDEERGVARAIIETVHGEIDVDVAYFRGEQGDILSDVRDRDFTLNAMMVDLKGDLSKIIDPLNGEQDVADKVIRRCSDIALAADPIRALRAVRQSQQLGFRIEPTTLKDIRAVTNALNRVSPERIRDELFKLLELKRPAAAVRVMEAIGLLDAIVPVTSVSGKGGVRHICSSMDKASALMGGLVPGGAGNLAQNFGYGLALTQLTHVRKQLAAHLSAEWAGQRSQRGLFMLALLLQDFPTDDGSINAVAKRLRLSNNEKARLKQVVGARNALIEIEDFNTLGLHRFWYTLRQAGVDVCLFTLVDYLARQGVHLEQYSWLQRVEKVKLALEAYFLDYENVVEPPPLVSGSELIEALDLEPGAIIGQLLDVIREAQVMGEVETAEGAIAFARAALGDDARGALRR